MLVRWGEGLSYFFAHVIAWRWVLDRDCGEISIPHINFKIFVCYLIVLSKM
jgi:hypothetical protein